MDGVIRVAHPIQVKQHTLPNMNMKETCPPVIPSSI